MKKKICSIFVIAILMMSCAGTSNRTGTNTTGTSTGNKVSSFFKSLRGSPADVEKDWFTDPGSPKNETNNSVQSPKSIIGHEWKLIQVYLNDEDTQFSRSALPAEPENLFTLKFDSKNISGVGMPNLYSAPYTQGKDQSLSISLMRATMMASLFQPENITEHNFFIYLQNAQSWKIVDNNLEILSKAQDGVEVKLVFSL